VKCKPAPTKHLTGSGFVYRHLRPAARPRARRHTSSALYNTEASAREAADAAAPGIAESQRLHLLESAEIIMPHHPQRRSPAGPHHAYGGNARRDVPVRNLRRMKRYHRTPKPVRPANPLSAAFDHDDGASNRRSSCEHCCLLRRFRPWRRRCALPWRSRRFQDGQRQNDTHGHAAGDDCLRETAERPAQSLRRCALIARLGGDESPSFSTPSTIGLTHAL